MSFDALLFQALNGLAAASGLFFVGAGLSLIFGVSRIVNIAHGSLYMLGIYIAYSIATKVGGAWASGAPAACAAPRRRDRRADRDRAAAPHLSGARVVPIARHLRGPAGDQRRHALDLGQLRTCSGRARRACAGSVEILNRRFPSYDLFLIAVGPWCFWACISCWQERFGRLIRAATQDREMVGALGVNQALLFTAVFACGSALAGLGGALQLAREPANLAMDLVVLGDAFVVVVVGGMGSITGAYLAAVHHRRDQGAVHRHRRGEPRWHVGQFLQAHAGRGVPGDGGGTDRAALGLLGRPQIAVRNTAADEEPLRAPRPHSGSPASRR